LALAVAAGVARAVALGGRGQRRGGRWVLPARRLGGGDGGRLGRRGLDGLGLLLDRRALRLGLRLGLAGRGRRLRALAVVALRALGLAVVGAAVVRPAVVGAAVVGPGAAAVPAAAVLGLGLLLRLLLDLLLGLAGRVGPRGRVLDLPGRMIGLRVLALALGLARRLVGTRAGRGGFLGAVLRRLVALRALGVVRGVLARLDRRG